MLKVDVPLSAISQVDKTVRLRSMISSRLSRLSAYLTTVDVVSISVRKLFDDDIYSLKRLLDRLDNNIVIRNTYFEVLRSWNKFPPNFEQHCRKIFGSFYKRKFDPRLKLKILNGKRDYYISKGRHDLVRDLDVRIKDEVEVLDLMDSFFSNLTVATALGRKVELLRRLYAEVEWCADNGWYFMFNTLTVAPEYMSEVFPDDDVTRSTAWNRYVRRMDRVFAESAFGSVRKARLRARAGDEYHSYFAVVEEGGKGGRLHIHVLHCFKSLPIGCSDPNFGQTISKYREISFFKKFWTYGFSSPIAVRFSAVDSYARLGWRWPSKLDVSLGVYMPVDSKPASALCSYIGKYITKAYLNEKEHGLWRTRLSRNLGVRPLMNLVNQLCLKDRLMLLSQPRLVLPLRSTKAPRYLLRRLLLRSLPTSVLMRLYVRLPRNRPLSFVKRFRAMTEGQLLLSLQSSGDIKIRTSRLTGVFSVFNRSTYEVPLKGVPYVV